MNLEETKLGDRISYSNQTFDYFTPFFPFLYLSFVLFTFPLREKKVIHNFFVCLR